MLEYVEFSNEPEYSNDPWMFSAENQCWDDDTLQQLKEDYGIIFMANGDGVIPVMISEDWGIVLGIEDDGTIKFERRYGQPVMCFAECFAECLIADLKEACKIIKSKNKVEYPVCEDVEYCPFDNKIDGFPCEGCPRKLDREGDK